jgi:hypothetical protein
LHRDLFDWHRYLIGSRKEILSLTGWPDKKTRVRF